MNKKETVFTPTKVKFDWKCPKCGHNVLEELSNTRTTAHYPRILEDGVDINPDRNALFTSYMCLKCHHTFTVQHN